jgi:2-aminomuconate deaminase
MKKSEKYQVRGAPRPMGAYPHARRVGDFLFLSGIGPRNPQTNEVPGVTLDDSGRVIDHDIVAQCHAVFENVRVVLESTGVHWDQLVDVTVFLTDIDGDFEKYNKVYAEYFKTNAPCRTTVGISGLPSPIAIELKCIAYIGSQISNL